MAPYRASYAKTAIMAAIGGTGCLLLGVVFLCAPAIEWLGVQAVLLIPSPVRILAGILCLMFALFGYSITAGGMLALHYDAKGRAVFE